MQVEGPDLVLPPARVRVRSTTTGPIPANALARLGERESSSRPSRPPSRRGGNAPPSTAESWSGRNRSDKRRTRNTSDRCEAWLALLGHHGLPCIGAAVNAQFPPSGPSSTSRPRPPAIGRQWREPPSPSHCRSVCASRNAVAVGVEVSCSCRSLLRSSTRPSAACRASDPCSPG